MIFRTLRQVIYVRYFILTEVVIRGLSFTEWVIWIPNNNVKKNSSDYKTLYTLIKISIQSSFVIINTF